MRKMEKIPGLCITDNSSINNKMNNFFRYDRKECPKTLELLGKAVHIDVSPDLTEEQVGGVSK